MIDHYCERLGPGLLAEPLNALSNLAFVAVAVIAWRCPAANRGARLLAALIGAVAIASFAWHSLAAPWARWLDIVALLAFQVAWLWIYSRETLGFMPRRAALVLLAFGLVLLPAAAHSTSTDGLLLYLPTLATLLALGWHRRARSTREPNLLLGAAALFAIALALRTADARLCAALPVGTHFTWHLLTALVAWLAMRSLASDHAATSRGEPD